MKQIATSRFQLVCNNIYFSIARVIISLRIVQCP
jgi:hypothetical protein